MLLRVRLVFLKQCIAWMVHGEFQDPGNEFFIQAKQQSNTCSREGLISRALKRIGVVYAAQTQAKLLSPSVTSDAGSPPVSWLSAMAAREGERLPTVDDSFDWTNRY